MTVKECYDLNSNLSVIYETTNLVHEQIQYDEYNALAFARATFLVKTITKAF